MAEKTHRKVKVVWKPIKGSAKTEKELYTIALKHKNLLDKLREYDLKHQDPHTTKKLVETKTP